MKFLIPLFILTTIIACNHYKTVDEQPATQISSEAHRGANDLIELGNNVLACMQDKIPFTQLTYFIPNKTDIAQLYALTKTPIDSQNINTNAELVLKNIATGFANAKNDGILQEFEWKDVSLENVTSQVMPGEAINSKLVYWNLLANKKHYRLTAKCMQIGNYWFLGEDIRFNITGL